MELLHVTGDFLPLHQSNWKVMAAMTNFRMLVRWADGFVMDGLNDIKEEVFIDSLLAAVDVAQHMVSDFSVNDGSDGFSGALLGLNCCLDGVVLIVCFDFCFCMGELDLGGIPSGTGLSGGLSRMLLVVMNSIYWIWRSALVWAYMRSFMPSPRCVSL